MKKIVSFLLLSALAVCCLSACTGRSDTPESDATMAPAESEHLTESTPPAESTAPAETQTASSESAAEPSAETAMEPTEMPLAERRLKMIVEGQEISILLYDTSAANALYEALPMELNFTDYNDTEKIAYLPDELPTEGEPDGCDPDVGDLCFYVPWRNLSIFYQDFRYSQSLIKLGHIESGMDVLSGMDGDFTVTLKKVE